MKSDGKWYVRNTAGKVFGPIDFGTLQSWVRDGRIEPLAGISEDLQNWMLAPLKPELEMDWIVENNPGQFYGPTHKAVVDDFVKSGTLSAGARFYCDDHGRTLEALKVCEMELEKARKELEAVKTEKATEALKASKTIKDLTATEAGLEAEVAGLRAELEKVKGELGELKAEKAAVHVREWKTEVLVPEVVVSGEPPPSTARSFFGKGVPSPVQAAFDGKTSSLAELERQAQAELVRMGASGANKFFGLGRRK